MPVEPPQLDAVSKLVGALAWPLVGLIVALLFRRPLQELLRRDEVEVKGQAGLSVSAKGQGAAASALIKASESRSDGNLDLDTAQGEVELASEGVARLGRSPRILWVDDNPSNNRHERAALTALGMYVEFATSTDAALDKLSGQRNYDVIISDMGRPPDPKAGYTLLSDIRSRRDDTPFIIYAASRSPEHFNEAVRRGALGCTNSPAELMDMVSNALRGRAP